MEDNRWARLRAYVTGLVNEQLLVQNEYLAAENRILRAHLPTRLRLSDPGRCTLAEIGKRLGRKALQQVACVAKPDTILAWYRKLVARKFDGSRQRSYPGRPPVSHKIVELVVQMARENPGWGYDRIVGALANLGHVVSDQTVGNLLRRHGLAPAPKRSQNTNWKDFIASHMAVLAGVDFFTVEVLTWRGLATYYVLFFLHLETRRVSLAGVTRHPTETWIEQMARNATDETSGYLRQHQYVLHDRDTKFCASFRAILETREREIPGASAAQPKSERIRRTLGAIRQAGVPFQTDPVRGGLIAAGAGRVPGALPRRPQSPGQRQCPTIPRERYAARSDPSMPTTARRPPELLRPRPHEYFDHTGRGRHGDAGQLPHSLGPCDLQGSSNYRRHPQSRFRPSLGYVPSERLDSRRTVRLKPRVTF
jgi:transposase